MATIKPKKLDAVKNTVSNALRNEVESLYSVLGLSTIKSLINTNKTSKAKPNKEGE